MPSFAHLVRRLLGVLVDTPASVWTMTLTRSFGCDLRLLLQLVRRRSRRCPSRRLSSCRNHARAGRKRHRERYDDDRRDEAPASLAPEGVGAELSAAVARTPKGALANVPGLPPVFLPIFLLVRAEAGPHELAQPAQSRRGRLLEPR